MSQRRDPSSGDGRNIDARVGSLGGEASSQAVPTERPGAEGAVPYDVFSGTPAHGPAGREATYYDRPMLKEPVWIWPVPSYFYAGGSAGAAAVIGAVAQALDPKGFRGLVTRCRWITLAGTTIGAALLVYDLGRPKRFLNMLRVFRPTSTLNMGSWIVSASGALSAGSLLLSRLGPSVLEEAAGYAAGVVGLPMSGYTAVLLSDTSVPLWQGTRRSLPPLFVASGLSGAASLLALTSLGEVEEKVVERLSLGGKLAEIVAMYGLERDAARVPKVAEPLHVGLGGSLWKAAKAVTVAGIGVSLLPRAGRIKSVASALLGTAGALLVRFAVFHAGKASARDPRATSTQQRAGKGAREATGFAAVTGPHNRRATT